MSKSIHQLLAAGAVLIFTLFGSAGSLQAGCNTVAQTTTCTPANGQLVYDDPSGKYMPYGTGASTIVASGVGGPVSVVTVTLNNVNQTSHLGYASGARRHYEPRVLWQAMHWPIRPS
jgi:hypothetical protein